MLKLLGSVGLGKSVKRLKFESARSAVGVADYFHRAPHPAILYLGSGTQPAGGFNGLHGSTFHRCR